jgi:hypothetical protein
MLTTRSYYQRTAARAALLSLLVAVVPACSKSNDNGPPAEDLDAAKAADVNADGTAGDGASAPVTVLRPWDWAGIVGTGQSLSIGALGLPFVATSQPYHNLKLSLGAATVPPFDPMSSELSLVPLVEPIRPTDPAYPSAYPGNLDGESPHTAMADEITALVMAATAGGDYVTVHTVVGESGQPMTVIQKGAVEMVAGTTSMGRAYAATTFEATAIARLAAAQGKTYGVGAVVITHGEADAGNAGYEAALFKLWSDYNQDLSAITGQTQRIPMFVSQQHSVPADMGMTSISTQAEWKVGVDHAGDIVCSGPKYQYPYQVDHVHLTTAGYERLGEKYGEVYYEKVVLGRDWQPLQPTTVDRAGAVITVHYHVPVSPMTWDETIPAPHQTVFTEWAMGRGFEVTASGSPVMIESVQIVDDTIQITCARDLTGAFVVLSYAQTTDGTSPDGRTARAGQLRDSDPFVGSTTMTTQPNYGVSFTMTLQ